ncbi:MAG: Na(+)-translocating NADH-quinone reductase subunit C [Desulfopila sp.]
MVDITPAKPFYSVLVLAFVCSALVAGAAVGLRPKQEANRQLDRQKNILYAAGIFDPDKPIAEQFANIETRVVELKTGKFVDPALIDPQSYNQRRAAYTSDLGTVIPRDEDTAGITRQERYSLVYLVKKDDRLAEVVLPVRGKGLWSTMYAYVAVDADLTTVRGVSFYEHGETPGLGGEVANRTWENTWQGKELYKDDRVALRLTKGGVDPTSADAPYQIDGLSGATLTSKGVSHLLEFWFGEHGFKPFFQRLASTAGTGSPQT